MLGLAIRDGIELKLSDSIRCCGLTLFATEFRAAPGRAGELSNFPMAQQDVYCMIGRRAWSAGIGTKIS